MDTHSAHAQVLHTLMKINNPTNMYYAKRTINHIGELTLGDVTWKKQRLQTFHLSSYRSPGLGGT